MFYTVNLYKIFFICLAFTSYFSKCEYVVIPQADDYVREKEKEFCPRCECKYERRNTTTIFVSI